MSRHIWASSASALLVLAMSASAWWWFNQHSTHPIVVITAALDVVERGLPVYAQFTMAQTLHIPEPVRATHLTVPIYFPAEATQPLVVELWRYDRLVMRWRYYSEKSGTVVPVHLPLTPPQLLDGEMEVRFAASSIAHDQREMAPRLFIESADTYYPAGHYYISQNQKSGDIALALYGQSTNSQLFLQELKQQPLKATSRNSRWVLSAAVIALLPYPLIQAKRAPAEIG